jgi:hypothetical protein
MSSARPARGGRCLRTSSTYTLFFAGTPRLAGVKPYPQRRFKRDPSPETTTMSNTIRSYRGLEIYPLVYPHQPRSPDGARHYDSGFDAAVRICRRGTDDTLTSSRVFRVPSRSPFGAAGDARIASASYAERVIDGMVAGESIAGL